MQNSASETRDQADRAGDDLTAFFAAQRPRLRAIAHRVLGSHWSADDAVQETWLRLQRTDSDQIDDLDSWLVIAVCRASIDQLRDRVGSFEESVTDRSGDPGNGDPRDGDVPGGAWPTDHVLAALTSVLDELDPLARVAFVLHDLFDEPYERIAPIVDQDLAGVRRLAASVRARVRAVDPVAERERQRLAVATFLRAAQGGDLGTLMAVLHPEASLSTDAAAVARAAKMTNIGAPLLRSTLNGATAVARAFLGRGLNSAPAVVDGQIDAAVVSDGAVVAIYGTRLTGFQVRQLEIVADETILSELTIRVPGGMWGEPPAAAVNQ